MNELTTPLDENTVKNSVRPQNKHLKPWKKGIPSPNPKGRGKGVLNYATLRKMAIEKIAKEEGKTPLEIDMEIQANALKEARKSNFNFYKDDKDRVFGDKSTPAVVVNLNFSGLFKQNESSY